MKKLLALLGLLLAGGASAQTQQVINCISSSPPSPCLATSQVGNGTQGDPAWMFSGKVNANFNWLWSVLGGATGGTGTGQVVLSNSPVLTTPNLGTPSAINLSNATALPNSALPANLASSPANTVMGCAASPCAPSGLTAAPLAALQNTYSSAAVLRARDYGILPTNTAAQNDTGFATLKTKMQSSATTVWRVIFEPGTYQYTNNRWLFFVNNVIIDAYGVTFQNTNTSSYQNNVPIQLRLPWDTSGDVAGPSPSQNGYTYQQGYLFNTASPGLLSVTTTTAANAGNFAPGNRVLLAGFAQQTPGSWPPNVRYVEFKTVLSANAGTGVVTFTEPVKTFYDSRWWDQPSNDVGGATIYAGAPRIINLNATGVTWASMIWIKGATFLASSAPENVLQTNGADLFILEDVTANVIDAVGANQVYLWRDHVLSTVPGDPPLLIDKGTDTVLVDGGEYSPPSGSDDYSVYAPGSPLRLILKNAKLYGSVNLAAGHVQISNVDIVANSTDFACVYPDAGWYMDTIEIDNTRCDVPSGGLSYGAQNTTSGTGWTGTAGVGSTTTTVQIPLAIGYALLQTLSYRTILTDTTSGSYGPISGIYASTSTPTISAVSITGSAGQFACTCTNLAVGQVFTISGTYGGTGSITGYSNPTNYYISATNGTSTFTLQTLAQGAIVTTAGTPSGLTYTASNLVITIDNTAGSWNAGVTSGDTLTWTSPTVSGDGGGNILSGSYLASNKSFWSSPPMLVGTPSPPYTFLGTTSINRTGASDTDISDTSNSGHVVIGNDSNAAVQIFGPINIENNGTKNVGIMNGSASGSFYLGSNSISSININGFTQINVSNNASTRIGTGTTTSDVTIGGDHNLVTLGSPTVMGATTATATVSASTCATLGTYAGSGTAGSFVITTGGAACIFTVTLNGATGMTAPTGWVANADDVTTGIHCTNTATVSQTTVVFTCTTVSGNTIKWSAVPY